MRIKELLDDIFLTDQIPLRPQVLLLHAHAFSLLRTFLRELENCLEKPEMVGICFLKRVSLTDLYGIYSIWWADCRCSTGG